MKHTYYYLEFADPQMDFHLTIPDHAVGLNTSPKTSFPEWTRLGLVRSSIGANWFDLRNYDLSIDTGMVGLEAAEEILYSFVKNSATFKRVLAHSHDLAAIRFTK